MEAAGPERPSFVLPVLNTANYSNDWHGEILPFMKQWRKYYGWTKCLFHETKLITGARAMAKNICSGVHRP